MPDELKVDYVFFRERLESNISMKSSLSIRFNPIPTSKKSYIKDHPRAESALVYMKSNLVLSLYYSDVPGGVVVSTRE